MSRLACEPLPQLDRVMDRMLTALPLDPERGVCVAGPCAVDVMGELCRRGFRRVEFARAATCACADEGCETLLVGFVDEPDEVEAVLDRVAPMLHEDGVFMVDVQGLTTGWDRAVVKRMLRQAGFARPVQCGDVLIARKLPLQRRRAA